MSDRKDKQALMLADHQADLIHEEALLNCSHDNWVISDIMNKWVDRDGIPDTRNDTFLECEVTCSFCGKNNYLRAPLSIALDALNEWACPPHRPHLILGECE